MLRVIGQPGSDPTVAGCCPWGWQVMGASMWLTWFEVFCLVAGSLGQGPEGAQG